MPDRVVRKGVDFIDKHATLLIFIMLVTMLLTAIFASVGWNQARQAQNRLNSVEETQRAEKLGKQIADVTTCFNRARNTPRFIVILRGLALELEPDPRQAVNELISEYEQDVPSKADCVALAKKNGIDPRPYLKNPPSEAGNNQGR